MIREATFEQLMASVPEERIEQSQAYWADRSLEDVMGEMPAIERHGFADLAVVEPDTTDTDESRTLVLPLEFTQGYTAPHYMRAKVLQQYVAPASRVVIMPNSTYGTKHIDLKAGLTKEQKHLLREGDYTPYGQLLMHTLEEADSIRSLGVLGLVGSSQAGTSVLGITAAGSDRLRVDAATAIETPNKEGREVSALAADFMKSGGDLSASVRESEIPAQLEAMSGLKLAVDLGKFGTRPFTREGRLIARSMTGTINAIAKVALKQLPKGALSLMYVEGSTVYDPESLSQEVAQHVKQTKIVGDYAHGHSTPNNLRFNGAMAYDGLVAGR